MYPSFARMRARTFISATVEFRNGIKMPRFSVETYIGVKSHIVWAVLADYGNVSEWNLGIRQSKLTSDGDVGVGSVRHCEMDKGMYIDERVLEWDEGKSLVIEMTDSNMPIKSFIAEFALRADGTGTIVTMTPTYTPSYGIMGLVGDAMFGRRKFKGMMQSALSDLKEYAEARKTEARVA